MKRAFSLRRSFSTLMHATLRIALPVIVLICVSQDLKELAFVSVFLFKWRVLAVKSRFWAVNIRANMIDILVGLSIVEFMSGVSIGARVGWALAFVTWVLYVKKLSGYKGMIAQAVIAQAVAYSALLYGYDSSSFGLVLAAVWVISYFSARHVLSAFAEDHAPMLAHIWALFSLQLFWVLWHFQIDYFFIEQAALLSTVLLLAFSVAYSMSRQENPNKAYIKQIFISSIVMSAIIVLLSNWRQDIGV